jgi:hypothetical protein
MLWWFVYDIPDSGASEYSIASNSNSSIGKNFTTNNSNSGVGKNFTTNNSNSDVGKNS